MTEPFPAKAATVKSSVNAMNSQTFVTAVHETLEEWLPGYAMGEMESRIINLGGGRYQVEQRHSSKIFKVMVAVAEER